jgi:CBS domain-containing protein
MIASDLQVSLPTVNRKTSAVVAARLIARAGFAALVLADDDGRPASLVPAADVLRLVVRDGEGSATVADLLDDRKSSVAPIPRVDAGASLEEAASRMAASGAAVAVVDADPRAPRFVLLPVVLDALLATRADPD